jgi:cytoskeletal protein CcmA (bactofilin family)
MSVFGKKDESTISASKSMNQLGQGTTIVGNLQSDSDIRIDGKVQGNLSTKGRLVLGVNGVIDGDVICNNGFIEGKINGKVECIDLLVLSKTAFISGDIMIKKLVVEEGAKFNGRCTMGIQVSRQSSDNVDSAMKAAQ